MTETKNVTVQANDTIKARIYVTECSKKDGTKFNTYKILETSTHRRIDLRFTKSCGVLPTEDCYIVVKKGNINKDLNRDYPCYWVKSIEETLPLKLSKVDVSKYFVDDNNE